MSPAPGAVGPDVDDGDDEGAGDDDGAVPVARLTVVDADPLDAEDPERWLASADGAAELDAALGTLRRLLHLHRVAAAEPDPFAGYEIAWLAHVESGHPEMVGQLARRLPDKLRNHRIRLLGIDHHQYMAGTAASLAPGFTTADELAASKADPDYWAAQSHA